MDPFQIRQALKEVRNLKKNILDKQLFKGYSGRARALGGLFALLAGGIAKISFLNNNSQTLFWFWGFVFLSGFLINYGALVFWIRIKENRSSNNLSIVLETLPVWLVGGVLTLALFANNQYDLLYGSWMCLFGLAQSITRPRLPKQITWIGLYYVACGTACLLLSNGIFSNPLLMGTVFFIGEFTAGIIMHTDGNLNNYAQLFQFNKTRHGK